VKTTLKPVKIQGLNAAVPDVGEVGSEPQQAAGDPEVYIQLRQ